MLSQTTYMINSSDMTYIIELQLVLLFVEQNYFLLFLYLFNYSSSTSLISSFPFNLFFFFFFKHKKKIDEKPFSIFLKSKPQGNKEEDVERKRRIGGKKKRKKKVGGWRNKSREKVKIYILKNFKFNNLKS